MSVISILLCLPAQAQQPLPLSDAISIALRNSLNVQIARNNTEVAKLSNTYGMAGGLPTINASVNDNLQSTNIDQQYSDASRNTLRNGVVNNNLQAALAGSIVLYNGSRIITTKDRLNIASHYADQQLVSKTMTVATGVMLRYFDIIRQQSYGTTLSKSIEVSRKKLDIIKAQQAVGMANNADLFQAQVDLNTQTLALQSQQLIIDQDKTDLLYLLSLNPDSSVSIRDTIIVDRSLQLETLLAAIDRNPDMIMAADQVDIAQHLQRETAALRYPALSLNSGYNFNRSQYAAGFTLVNQQAGPYVGVGLNVPVFNGSVYKHQYNIAGINAQTARMAHDSLQLSYTSAMVKNWQAYKNNLLQLETAQNNFQTASSLLDLTLQRFQLHQNTILDIENAQQSYENAANLLINIAYAAKAAEIQLKRLANRLDL
jgi:outer membrane protein TolC